MNIAQFIWHGRQYTGDILPNRCIRLFKQPCSFLDVVKMSLKKRQTLSQYIADNLSNTYLDIVDIASPSFIFKAISHRHPVSTWICSTELVHEDETISRKSTASEAEGAKWFFKEHMEPIVTSGEVLPMSSHDVDGRDAAELVGIYYMDENKHMYQLGFCLGHEFSVPALENIDYVHIPSCQFHAVGAEIMIDEVPPSMQLTSSIYRNEQLFWRDKCTITQNHIIHCCSHMTSHMLDESQWMMADTLYYHFVSISHTHDRDDITVKDNDIVKIDSDCFKFPLVNQIHKHKLDKAIHTNSTR